MERSRALQHSSITQIGSDHYSIAPRLRSPSTALSHSRSQSHKWIFDINSTFTRFPIWFFPLFVSFFLFFFHIFLSDCAYYTTEMYFPPHLFPLSFLFVDNDGRGPNVLSAVQTEDMSQVGEQHQRWRLQLQLLPTQNRALCRYVQLLAIL